MYTLAILYKTTDIRINIIPITKDPNAANVEGIKKNLSSLNIEITDIEKIMLIIILRLCL